MDVFKLRIKLGQDELEAEGSQDYVEKQREIFLARVSTNGTAHAPNESNLPGHRHNGGSHAPVDRGKETDGGSTATNLPISVEDMNKIVHQNDELLTLTAMPTGGDPDIDALLLLLLGHKVLRSTDLVPAGTLLAGMRQSGFPNVDRLDKVTPRVESSWLSSVGSRKGKKYRLLNPGISKAKEVAKLLISSV